MKELITSGRNLQEGDNEMNVTGYQSRVVEALRTRDLPFRGALLAFAALATIGLASVPAGAQTNDPRLAAVLRAIADGRQVSAQVSLPLNIGFFNGQTALYITPEVGVDPNAPADIITAAQHIATGFNANYIPQTFGTLPNSAAVDDIFVFTNFAQGNVLASAPNPAGPTNTDQNYSPLWQISEVTWNSGSQGRVLTSQTDIQNAASAGEVTITKTPIIVECSVIFTPTGGLLPAARVRPAPPPRRPNSSKGSR